METSRWLDSGGTSQREGEGRGHGTGIFVQIVQSNLASSPPQDALPWQVPEGKTVNAATQSSANALSAVPSKYIQRHLTVRLIRLMFAHGALVIDIYSPKQKF